ncbi:TolC family protein [Cupriavidus sp. DF5525]|uniref:TolC family protein n=1 Tax=Cupriavidus sp. DF5525 TaxID=3160989 RepID=UPI0035A99B4D
MRAPIGGMPRVLTATVAPTSFRFESDWWGRQDTRRWKEAAFARPLPLGDAANLLRHRPDIRAAERRLAAATAQVGVATADLFPRISLTGFIGFLSGNPDPSP